MLGQCDLYVRDFGRPDHTLILDLGENSTIRIIFNCELADFVPLSHGSTTHKIQIRFHIDEQGNRDYIEEQKIGNGKEGIFKIWY